MANITIKRGDTLFLQCSVASNSLPQSLQNWQIKSTVKFGPRPVSNLTVTKSSDSATVTTVNTGIVGPKGDIGPQGPEYQGDDLPDFTLIFENKLI